ncbi:MAG: HAD hydrolase-like protein [Chloroflexota bacterium]|nr:HAD hydrolase-like protein [Chloroflexota bacterium]
MINWIAFDADDTLWHNEKLYLNGRDRFHGILAKYQLEPEVDEILDATEIYNIRYYGYGAMSFTLSLIEVAIRVTRGYLTAEDTSAILDLGKDMLTAELPLANGVHEILSALSASHPLMVITKGDLFHQRRKVNEAGLRDYFQAVEVVCEKNPPTYQEILTRYKIEPEQFLMVGNSLRSDIKPILELGGWAVHILNDLRWAHDEAEIPQDLRGRYVEVKDVSEVREAIKELGVAS